jgi:hypothetical protein
MNCQARGVHEVRRDDGELCGFVTADDVAWRALTVFGGLLGTHGTDAEARAQVADVGLASLTERWVLTDAASGAQELVGIREASPGLVVVGDPYYSLPGEQTRTITVADLEAGRWRLERDR